VTIYQQAKVGYTMALLTLWGGLTATLRWGWFVGMLALIDMYVVSLRISMYIGWRTAP
jgi:hypothetical protein